MSSVKLYTRALTHTKTHRHVYFMYRGRSRISCVFFNVLLCRLNWARKTNLPIRLHCFFLYRFLYIDMICVVFFFILQIAVLFLFENWSQLIKWDEIFCLETFELKKTLTHSHKPNTVYTIEIIQYDQTITTTIASQFFKHF